MSTGAIIAIVVGALIILALLIALVPRMRARRRARKLEARRGAMADRHREVAAEQEVRAREAEGEAKRAQAEAELHQARAELHERGLADEELDGSGEAHALDGRDGRTTGAEAAGERPLRRA